MNKFSIYKNVNKKNNEEINILNEKCNIPYYGYKYYCVIKYIFIKYLEEIIAEIIILYNYEIVIYIYIINFL